MPALSTAWNADGRYTARGLLATLARMGLREIELSYQCGPVEVRDYASACRAMGFRVVSVHNFCPVPENAPAGRARSEALLLSSLEEGERRRAVEATRRSIETAAGLGAGTLILHLGRVEVSCRTRELIGLYRAGLRGTPRWESILGRMRAQRAAKRGPHFSAALRSLDELCGAASDAALALAVENRFYHREIPSYGELREILRRFAGGPVGYWHDIGHAQVMENLGFCRHEEYLDAAGAVLRGFHVHDVLLCRDHLPPPRGMVDFSRFAGRAGARVIELSPVHGAAAVERCVRFLERTFGEPPATARGASNGAQA